MGPRAAEKRRSSVVKRLSGHRRARLAASLAALPVLALGAVDCYSTGDGSPPPLRDLYFPVGLQVSAGGTV
ncbi:hypothetical protein, partial [Salmonella enterica]|uniref:hypothetical protein n=1 Tax=Salmonella enterica TaxID=28901 RepID=UPI0019D658F6